MAPAPLARHGEGDSSGYSDCLRLLFGIFLEISRWTFLFSRDTVPSRHFSVASLCRLGFSSVALHSS